MDMMMTKTITDTRLMSISCTDTKYLKGLEEAASAKFTSALITS